MRHLLGAAALLALAAPAPAQEAGYVSGDGTGYEATDIGIGTALQAAGDLLVLLPDCSAGAAGGAGTWVQANGGFLVTLPDREVGFPRQEIVVAGADCPL
jgi:hypothetical protein